MNIKGVYIGLDLVSYFEPWFCMTQYEWAPRQVNSVPASLSQLTHHTRYHTKLIIYLEIPNTVQQLILKCFVVIFKRILYSE